MTQAPKEQDQPGATRGWAICRLGTFTLDISWEVTPARILALFGPSGAGKTTLLKAVAGLIRPQEGHIEINGRTVFDSASGAWIPPHLRRVGFLTQSYNLFPHLTVEGNIGYGLRGQDPAQKSSRVQALIESFELKGLENRRPGEISGGQQQRAALARALASEPALMLLDEPFNSLDIEMRRTLRNELRRRLEEAGVPALLVTHDIEEAISMGDMVQVIENGRAIESGSPLDILGQPGQGRVARLVGVENLLRLQVASRHPQDGTMVCVCQDGSNIRLEVPLSDVSDGEMVTVGIRASDIILANSEPLGSSARNRLPGEVTEITLRPPGYEVTLSCQGVPIKCHITGPSLNEMAIGRGSSLWAIFKASSCFLVRDDG